MSNDDESHWSAKYTQNDAPFSFEIPTEILTLQSEIINRYGNSIVFYTGEGI